MSFLIDSTLDPEKAFLVRLSKTMGRLDPSFHRPYFRRRRAELDASSYSVVALGALKGRIFQGVGRRLVEGAPTCLLKVKNITPDGEIDFTDTEPVADVPKSKLLQPGDIISPFIGAAIKGYKFARFAGAEQPFTVDNNTGVIRITDNRITSDYLHAFCQTGLIRWQLDQLTGGGGVPFLGSEYARRIRLPLPLDGVQEAAVAMLRDAKRKKDEAEQKASALLRGIDDVLLNELGISRKAEPPNTLERRIFGTPSAKLYGGRWDVPFHSPRYESLERQLGSIRTLKIHSLATQVFSGITPLSGGDAYAESDEGVAFIRSGDFASDGSIDEDALIHIKPQIHNGLMRRSRLQKYDVLFAIVGATIGKVGIFKGDYEANINQAVCAVRCKDPMTAQFVQVFFLSSLGQEQISRLKRPVARANVNLEEIETLRVPILEPRHRERIVRRVAAIQNSAKSLRAQARADFEKAKGDIEALILGKDAAQ